MSTQGITTQQFIDIAGIQEGIIIMKNGGYRLILQLSAINFSLKSEEEQNSIIFQYQSFLNSLHFPIQVVIQSKLLDLNPYIKKIQALKEKQTNELIRLQTEDYIDYVSQLINVANIMKKTFFVVVSYDPTTIKSSSIIDKIFRKDEPASLRVSDQDFKRYKEQLTERANITASGLGSMGLHCTQLTTEQIIEMFYKIYNPETADKERFSDVNTIDSTLVAKSDEKGKIPEEKIISNESEEVIDNSMMVEEQKKEEAQQKQRENAKADEKEIAKTPPQKAGVTPSTGQETPKPAAPSVTPSGTNQSISQ